MRILFVARQNSVHTARWINHLADSQHEILLFPPFIATHHHTFKSLERLTSWARQPKPNGTTNLLSLLPFWRGAKRAEKLVQDLTGNPGWREAWLKQVIKRLKPDIVHSLEFQSAGYLCLGVKEEMGSPFPIWIASNWGNDIYLFGKVSDPKGTIKRVLRHADFYSAECMRDVRIAREWGFTGHVLPIFPNVGGFDIPAMRKYISSDEKTSSRRTIAVMGNQHFAGRPLTALDAICLCADELEKYKIRVYSATPDVELMVQLVATDYGLDIQCVPLPSPRAEILKLLGSARISIGIGISDGISTSFLEALILGSFPIQSNTASVNEWIVDGESGFIVSPIRSEEIAAKIKQALSDDSLVDNAGRINAQMADVKLAEERMKPTIKTMYDAIAKGASVEALHCEGRR